MRSSTSLTVAFLGCRFSHTHASHAGRHGGQALRRGQLQHLRDELGQVVFPDAADAETAAAARKAADSLYTGHANME